MKLANTSIKNQVNEIQVMTYSVGKLLFDALETHGY